MEHFIARYEHNGLKRAYRFDKNQFTEQRASEWMQSNGIQNFSFFFEPSDPINLGDNEVMFRGEVGFDITLERLLPYLHKGNKIVIDSYGGSLFEGYRIMDAINHLGAEIEIGILGIAASAATLIPLATKNNWATPNARFLIHNPWIFDAGDAAFMEKKAAELRDEEQNLAKIYAKASGQTEARMRNLMKEERMLTAKEAKELGLITKINKSKVELKTDEMNEKMEEKLNVLEGLMNRVMAYFTPKEPKNIVISDANGAQLDFPEIEEESQIVIGSMANVDGAPAEGDYVIAGGIHDGKTFVFVGGALTEIMEVEEQESEEVAELREQVEALTRTNAELTKKVSNMVKVESEMKALKEQLESLRNVVTTGDVKDNTPPADNVKGGFSYKKKK